MCWEGSGWGLVDDGSFAGPEGLFSSIPCMLFCWMASARLVFSVMALRIMQKTAEVAGVGNREGTSLLSCLGPLNPFLFDKSTYSHSKDSRGEFLKLTSAQAAAHPLIKICG